MLKYYGLEYVVYRNIDGLARYLLEWYKNCLTWYIHETS